MPGLLGLLDVGSSGYQANTLQVATSGKNISNINTEGYSRESIDMGTQVRDDAPVLSSRERSAAGSSGMADAQAAALNGLETDLTQGSDISSAVGDFFGAADKLSASPAEESLRQAMVEKAKTLAGALQKSARAVATAQAEASQRIAAYAAQATELAKQVAAANKAMATSKDPQLADKRDTAAKKLAELMGGQARIDQDGQMRVTAAGGTVLVDGQKAMTVALQGNPADPTASKVVVKDGNHTDDVTGRLDGGKIAGELAFRDGTAKQAATDLDNLAYDLSTKVNAIHQNGVALDGTSGHNLFTQPTSASGAAAAMSVDPALAANSDLLSTRSAGEGTTGSGNVSALAALATSSSAGGNSRSFIDESIRIVGSVGQAASSANTAQVAAQAATASLSDLRDSASGVSQEDELTKLAGFQQVAAANTKFISTVNDMLTNLITTL